MDLKSTLKKKTPNKVINLGRTLVNITKKGRMKGLNILDKFNLISPDNIYSNSWFEEMANDDQLEEDAKSVVDVLIQEFDPDSVIDLGCGVGHYLKHFKESGISINGMDGAEAAQIHAVIDDENIKKHDLRNPYYPSRDYDLVVCIEVAEHLPEKYANVLVKSIVRCGETVVFTAATPGQGGSHHINEQPRQYWKSLFINQGMQYDEETVDRLRENIDVNKAEWVPENLFVFQKPI